MYTRQVVITVKKEKDNDKIVQYLQPAVDKGLIGHCHTYSNTEVPVIVDGLHPSINIQEEFIDNYLDKYYGPVKSWHPRRDSRTGIKTGEIVFIMSKSKRFLLAGISYNLTIQAITSRE